MIDNIFHQQQDNTNQRDIKIALNKFKKMISNVNILWGLIIGSWGLILILMAVMWASPKTFGLGKVQNETAKISAVGALKKAALYTTADSMLRPSTLPNFASDETISFLNNQGTSPRYVLVTNKNIYFDDGYPDGPWTTVSYPSGVTSFVGLGGVGSSYIYLGNNGEIYYTNTATGSSIADHNINFVTKTGIPMSQVKDFYTYVHWNNTLNDARGIVSYQKDSAHLGFVKWIGGSSPVFINNAFPVFDLNTNPGTSIVAIGGAVDNGAAEVGSGPTTPFTEENLYLFFSNSKVYRANGYGSGWIDETANFTELQQGTLVPRGVSMFDYDYSGAVHMDRHTIIQANDGTVKFFMKQSSNQLTQAGSFKTCRAYQGTPSFSGGNVDFWFLYSDTCDINNPTFCGNNVKETGEQCDDGANNGKTGDTCSATCQSVTTSACTSSPDKIPRANKVGLWSQSENHYYDHAPFDDPSEIALFATHQNSVVAGGFSVVTTDKKIYIGWNGDNPPPSYTGIRKDWTIEWKDRVDYKALGLQVLYTGGGVNAAYHLVKNNQTGKVSIYGSTYVSNTDNSQHFVKLGGDLAADTGVDPSKIVMFSCSSGGTYNLQCLVTYTNGSGGLSFAEWMDGGSRTFQNITGSGMFPAFPASYLGSNRLVATALHASELDIILADPANNKSYATTWGSTTWLNKKPKIYTNNPIVNRGFAIIGATDNSSSGETYVFGQNSTTGKLEIYNGSTLRFSKNVCKVYGAQNYGDHTYQFIFDESCDPLNPQPPFCGNGCCDAGEDSGSCSNDCPAPVTPPSGGGGAVAASPSVHVSVVGPDQQTATVSKVGDQATITLTVTNPTGASVPIKYTMPSGFKFDNTISGGSCTTSGSDVICTAVQPGTSEIKLLAVVTSL